jgi:hypothetical protein
MATDDLADELSRRRVAEGENRLPPAAAVVAALVVYALLPESVLFTSRFVIPVVEVLLLVALVVTNVIGFALLYWELDRGGPVTRRQARRDELGAADWRFSQDENDDAVLEVSRTSSESSGWVPIFVDYLYLSITNSSAFSPTDTMPLTSRAKVLMAVQATAALLTSLLVVARAVGSLGGG